MHAQFARLTRIPGDHGHESSPDFAAASINTQARSLSCPASLSVRIHRLLALPRTIANKLVYALHLRVTEVIKYRHSVLQQRPLPQYVRKRSALESDG